MQKENPGEQSDRLKHLFNFSLRWNWSAELKTGEGAIKRQLLSPSITARRAPADWRPGRRRSRLQRGSWGLITDPGGQGRVWVFKLTASVFMAFSKNRSPGHYSHSCLQSSQQTLIDLQSGPDSPQSDWTSSSIILSTLQEMSNKL